MPEEDGYALIRQVRALPAEEGGNTPAVALTAYARSEDRLKVILAGFQMHMAKPVEAAELLALVASLAGRVASIEGNLHRLFRAKPSLEKTSAVGIRIVLHRRF